MKGSKEPPTPTDVRRAGMDLLARREHSRLELRRKLGAREFPDDLIEQALDALQDDGLLSDQRFAESFAGSRLRRGQGPQRIVAELRQRGVGDALATDAVAELGADWFAEARAVRARRFGQAAPADYKERARQARFLQYRGFSAEQAMAATGETD